jgi:hypothetical protein
LAHGPGAEARDAVPTPSMPQQNQGWRGRGGGGWRGRGGRGRGRGRGRGFDDGGRTGPRLPSGLLSELGTESPVQANYRHPSRGRGFTSRGRGSYGSGVGGRGGGRGGAHGDGGLRGAKRPARQVQTTSCALRHTAAEGFCALCMLMCVGRADSCAQAPDDEKAFGRPAKRLTMGHQPPGHGPTAGQTGAASQGIPHRTHPNSARAAAAAPGLTRTLAAIAQRQLRAPGAAGGGDGQRPATVNALTSGMADGTSRPASSSRTRFHELLLDGWEGRNGKEAFLEELRLQVCMRVCVPARARHSLTHNGGDAWPAHLRRGRSPSGPTASRRPSLQRSWGAAKRYAAAVSTRAVR